jgi:hypothetical protein
LGSDGTLLWNNLLGGDGDDKGLGIALDGGENVYVAGSSTTSWGSPVRAHAGDSYDDAFVAKLNSDGLLIWNTFLGGDWSDSGHAIAVDGNGNIYVAGSSFSTWGSPARAHAGGYEDAFVAKLNSDGLLTWNTFLGGDGYDEGFDIALDGGWNVFVSGKSDSPWGSPVRAYTAESDAFAARLSSEGALIWNTFLGGDGSDRGLGIVMDGRWNVYVTGYSASTWGSPVRAHAGDSSDAFVAKLGGINFVSAIYIPLVRK